MIQVRWAKGATEVHGDAATYGGSVRVRSHLREPSEPEDIDDGFVSFECTMDDGDAVRLFLSRTQAQHLARSLTALLGADCMEDE
jgi:hypothetical protein